MVNIKDLKIDKTWSLFLDRDGVINKKLENNYVRKWEEFEFLPGVLDSLSVFAKVFGRIFIVTNQQGIGKGLMTEDDLKVIHNKMLKEIEGHGGRIDRIFHCPFKADENSKLRKPETGMGLLTQKEFPEVRFERSVMVGDEIIDMEFGKRLGMVNVFVGTRTRFRTMEIMGGGLNFCYEDLKGFSNDI